MKRTTMLIVVFAVFCAGFGSAQESEPQLPPAEDTAPTNRIDETTLTFDDADVVADEPAGDITSFGAADFIRMLLVLGFVICIIYALFFVLRRASNRNHPRSEMLQVLGTTQLSAGRSLHLVEIGGQVLLVGSSENSVNLISEVTNSETVDELLLEASARKRSASGSGHRRFGDILGDMLSRGRVAPDSVRTGRNAVNRKVPVNRPDEDVVTAAGGFYSEQRERLRQL